MSIATGICDKGTRAPSCAHYHFEASGSCVSELTVFPERSMSLVAQPNGTTPARRIDVLLSFGWKFLRFPDYL